MLKKFICHSISLLFISIASSYTSVAQNSLLVNFGTVSCTSSGEPAFSFIKEPLSISPSSLVTCSLAKQLPNIFGVFIAYNPKNNKIYVADIRSGIDTKIWVLDMGLPANINCPAALDSIPDYTYSYISNNFEFDNNGDLWSLSNYNNITGQCNMDKFDVNNGTIINTRLIQFPSGNFPTAISSGDITILPNGRMFATLGSFPSKLYEINNYSSTTTNATATFLDTIPQSCYGIAYLNGQLELAGSDFSGNCYYYKYNITTNVLDSATNFQDGQLPIDNTSITPSLGVTKQLVNNVKINDNTVDLTYEIYARNLGNVALNNINVSDNLSAVFGAGNVSDITVAFVTGDNAAGLALNPLYNGNNDSDLLIAGQSLINQTSVNTDYFLKLRLGFRVTNINPATVYQNSAIGSATIGSVGTLSFINVSDSSNNGSQDAVDPNNNGNAGEPGENNPTPFNLATLPVKFISVTASLVDNTSSTIKWVVATPTINSDKFEIEYSADGRHWSSIGLVNIVNANESKYQFLHTNIPGGNLYYRIKEIDIDGAYIYSNIVLLHNKNTSNSFIIFPNPANNFITISASTNGAGKTQIILYDAVGRQLTSTIMAGNTKEINTAALPDGAYVLKIINNGAVTTQKVMIMHR
ncbi:MAG: T9SS type A sorting domain-containing protein [Ginsengibacter sp.]